MAQSTDLNSLPPECLRNYSSRKPRSPIILIEFSPYVGPIPGCSVKHGSCMSTRLRSLCPTTRTLFLGGGEDQHQAALDPKSETTRTEEVAETLIQAPLRLHWSHLGLGQSHRGTLLSMSLYRGYAASSRWWRRRCAMRKQITLKQTPRRLGM